MISSRPYDRKAVFAWCTYDFANSAFTTLVVTFIYGTYFTKAIAENEIIGTRLWSHGVTISAIAIAILSPIMGALADRGNLRKQFLIVMTGLSVSATAVLYTALPGEILQALTWFVIANVAFEMGIVFYNAYLPEIAPPDKIGRISGYGWSFGYIGGLLALVIALIGFVNTDAPWFGFSTEAGENIRATNLLVAIWFAVFSIPIFFWVRDPDRTVSSHREPVLTASFEQLRRTFRQIRRYREIVKFLLARLFYNDGLITIFAFGGIYAAGTLGFSFSEILIFGIVLNLTAGLGAFALGFLDDKIGGKATIQISNIGLMLATLLAVLATNKPMFWAAGILVGIFSGPNQAASRSLMGRFVPRAKENEFYGFYSFSGKATTFLGPLLLGILTEMFNSQRAGIAAIIFFFVAGALILTTVNEKEGIALARLNDS